MIDYKAPEDLLKGKVVLVTGAGDGIGKCAAKTYAKHGATVILLGRTTSKLEQTYDEIIELERETPAIVPLDIAGATAQHYTDLATTILQQFGKLDGILHNASILGGPLTPFEHIKEKKWKDVMQVNVTGPFLMTQALLPVMRHADKPSIIFTSSGVGRQGRAFWGAYSVSKFATEGMMQTLADEYQANTLRVNCINPGATRTTMRATAFPMEDAETLKTPEDLMPLYLYLMGKDSDGVTGQSIDAQVKKASN